MRPERQARGQIAELTRLTQSKSTSSHLLGRSRHRKDKAVTSQEEQAVTAQEEKAVTSQEDKAVTSQEDKAVTS
eukprot:3258189-Rhodomonas_salina.4